MNRLYTILCLLVVVGQIARAQIIPAQRDPGDTQGRATVVALQNPVFANAKAEVQGGKPTVELKTGFLRWVKGNRTDQEATWAVSLDTYDGERAISFPMWAYKRQALLYGQVGNESTGLIFITDKVIAYRTDQGEIAFSCSKPDCTLKQEGGREGDTFSLYDERGRRFRFGPPKFDSPFMMFFRAAMTDFQRAYSQAEQFTSPVRPAPSEPVKGLPQFVLLAQQQAPQHQEEQVSQQAPGTQVAQAQPAPEAAQASAQQQAEQEEADRQQRIDQLKLDIRLQQHSAEVNEQSAQEMANSDNSTCTTPGLAALLCRGIGTAGIAKFKKEAAKARNQANADEEEIERLQGLEVQQRAREDESFSGNLQQAAANGYTAPQPQAISSSASPSSNSPETYDPNRHYSGPNASEVSTLLSQSYGWSCPSSSTASVSWQPPQKQVCMRDSYVIAAVALAYGAECEARLGRTEEAQKDADAMAENIANAKKMCSRAPVFGPGPECSTIHLVPCP